MAFLRITRWVIRIKLLLLALVAVTFLSLGLYLNTPRELPFLRTQMESALARLSEDYQLQSKELTLQWAGWRTGLVVQLNDVQMQSKDGQFHLDLPSAFVKLDTWRLLYGQVSLKKLMLKDATIALGTPEYSGFIGPMPMVDEPAPVVVNTASATPQVLMATLAHIIQQTSGKGVSPIQSIVLENITLETHSHQLYRHILVQRATLDMLGVGGQFTANFNLEGQYANSDFSVHGGATVDPVSQEVMATSEIKNLPAGILSTLHPAVAWVEGLNPLIVSGSLNLVFDSTARLTMLDTTLATEAFSSNKPIPSNPENPLNTLPVKVSVALDVAYVPQADGKGEIASPSLKGTLEARDVPMGSIGPFWPPAYEPHARRWVTQNISKGVYDSLVAKVNMAPADFVNVDLREEAVHVNLTFHDGEVAFDPRVAPLKSVTGEAQFHPNRLQVEAKNARFVESDVPQISVVIDHLGDPEMLLTVDGMLQGDVKHVLHLAEAVSAPGQQMFPNQERLQGTMDTNINMTMPIGPFITEYRPNVSVAATLHQFVYPDVLRNLSLTADNLTVTLEKNILNVTGPAALGGVPLALNYQEKQGADAGIRTNVSGMVTADQLAMLLDMPSVKESLQGTAVLDFTMEDGKKESQFSGTLDANNASFSIPLVNLNKPVNEPASLKFEGHHTLDGVILNNIVVEGKRLEAKAKGEYQKASSAAPSQLSLVLDNLRLQGTTLRGEVKYQQGKQCDVKLRGPQLNLRPVLKYLHDRTDITESAQPFAIQMDVDAVQAAGDVQVKNLATALRFDGKLWQQFDLSGDFAESGEFSATYGLPLDQLLDAKSTPNRMFRFTTDDAGAFIRAMDFSEHVKGGVMEISAETRDADEERVTRGHFTLKNYSIVQAPILAQILTLASFGGILDTLQGEGITFKSAKGDFLWRDDTLSILAMRSEGTSLGLTINGDIHMDTNKLDLGGAIVPAYFLNSALGEIPLVGELLVGKKGEGLIATRYTVKGTTQDADVSVNPLSILTPGFLRKIWGEKAQPENIPDLRQEPVEE